MMRRCVIVLLMNGLGAGILAGTAAAQTQSLRWQLAPFCDVVQVTLTSVSATQFTLVGASDRCGELAQTVPVDLAGSCQTGADGRMHCAWDAQAPNAVYGPTRPAHFSAVV